MTRTTLVRLRSVAALVAALAGLLLALVPTGAAHAAAYRYWGYYQLSGETWQFAPKGPADTKPEDGAVEGWRFAIGGESDTRLPRAVPTFDVLCGDATAKSGEKRVAVVIDYGRPADGAEGAAPPEPVGRCAVVDAAASGLDVLAAVADVRQDKGMICGIDDYPAQGCGDEVKTVSAEAKAADTPVDLTIPASEVPAPAAAKSEDDDSSTGTYVAIGVVVLAGAGVGYAVSRRRRAA